MKVEELMEKAKNGVDIRQVFGEPYERNGLTIIPVARISGGGGSGSGPSGTPQTGSGTGFGFRAEPTGVFVIKGDTVEWQPAVNVNKIVAGAFVVAVIALLRGPRIVKQMRKLLR
jgi:uncharacterized spore protein YtfJ